MSTSWGTATSESTVTDGAGPSLRPGRHESRYVADGDASNYISELVARCQGAAPEVYSEVIVDPISPASGIRAYLDRQPAGLIAVRTHSRSGVERLLLGATAASIVQASVAPCLVVPGRR